MIMADLAYRIFFLSYILWESVEASEGSLQLQTYAYIRLPNKPFRNEVTLR